MFSLIQSRCLSTLVNTPGTFLLPHTLRTNQRSVLCHVTPHRPIRAHLGPKLTTPYTSHRYRVQGVLNISGEPLSPLHVSLSSLPPQTYI